MTALLFAELSKFQKNMEGAKKDATNPHFKSKYADLESVVQCVKDFSKELKLAYTHITYPVDGVNYLKTILCYSDGEKHEQIESVLPLIISGNNPMQALGSAITYAKRYTLQGLYGIPSEDDDGSASTQPTKQPTRQAPVQAQPETPIAFIKKEIDTATSIDALNTICTKYKTHKLLKSEIIPMLSARKNAILQMTETEVYLDDSLDINQDKLKDMREIYNIDNGESHV